MAHQRAYDFNERAQGILEALDRASPEEVSSLATSFVEGVVANGWDNHPELCKDFAATLAKTIPSSEARAHLVHDLLRLCQKRKNSLALQLSRIIGEDLQCCPS